MVSDAYDRSRPSGAAPPGRGSPELTSEGGGPLIIDQAFDGESLYAIREAVAAHATQAGLPEGRVVDLVLAVHELAANAVRHGAGHGRLRVWNTGQVLRCEVTDAGAGEAMTAGADPAAWDGSLWSVERGHGLWLIRQVADQASLNTGPLGTVAVVGFALGAAGPPASFGLTERTARGCVIVSVTGPLDLGSAGQLTALVGDLMGATRGLRLVLDLAGLTRWDSAGLAALLAVQRQVGADPAARMVLAGLPVHLATRLRDAGRFALASGAEDAVGMLAPRSVT